MADDDRTGLIFGDQSWTHCRGRGRGRDPSELVVGQPSTRALPCGRPLGQRARVRLLAEGAALVGATVVGANATHRGDELARDLAHTECQFLITDTSYFPWSRDRIRRGLGPIARSNDRVLIVDEKRAADGSGPSPQLTSA